MSSPLPSLVGNSFVKQYYKFLAEDPDTLHKFYKDESQFTRGNGSIVENTISGQKEIYEKIKSMGYAGAQVDLEKGSVDCQKTLNDGVLVLVTGQMALLNGPPRQFVQTFFLAVQPAGYYVLNDAFRYLDVPTTTSSVQTMANSANVVSSPRTNKHSVKDVAVKEEKKDNNEVVKENKDVVAKEMEVVTENKEIVTENKVVEKAEVEKAEVEKAEVEKAEVDSPKKKEVTGNPAKESKTKVQSPRVESKVVSPKVEKAKAEPAQPKSWASHLFAAKVAENSVTSVTEEKKNGNSTTNGDGGRVKDKVLFVRDLPSQATENLLRNLFKPFGKITHITLVNVRGYAFVDFDSVEAVQQALAQGEFKMLDKVIQVEKRHDNRQHGNRGNFRSENGRGGRGGRGGRSSRMDRRERAGSDKDRRTDKGNASQRRGETPASTKGPNFVQNEA